jgi:enterochelin esterase-like enzyme
LTGIKLELNQKIRSRHLKREVVIDVVMPEHIKAPLPVLYMNDGQDYHQLRMGHLLQAFYKVTNQRFIYVGIHCNKDRIYEYGTAGIPDYKGRGNKAENHLSFVVDELVPFIEENYPTATKREDRYICGFSLGGLSALDIAWERPDLFSKVGVFSGSFWWRKTAFKKGYDDDKDRIMHQKIRNGNKKEEIAFWFECGTNDETSDRNNNGIIDSIDDTLDLIKELNHKGFSQTKYVEVKYGEHNFNTWRVLMPEFLTWLFDQRFD